MTDYTPDPTYLYFDELIETKTSIVPILSSVMVRRNGTVVKELSIHYYDPEKHALNRVYNKDFAAFIFDNLTSFERGMSSQILAGIVRPSKPYVVEQWVGDTIEKINYESFSLYKGILSIIGNNDGLPLVVPQMKGIVGNIIPGIKQILNGKNPTIVHQKIKQLESLQYRIADIIGDNPFKAAPVIDDPIKDSRSMSFQGLNDKQLARLEKLNNL